MRSTVRYTTVASLALAAVLAAAPVAAQDKAKAAPAAAPDKAKAAAPNQKVLVENDKVRAFEVRYKPGEGGDVRERPARIVRALTDGTMLRTYPDGKTSKVEWKAGEVKWFPKESFGNKNVGKNEIALYVVEMK